MTFEELKNKRVERWQLRPDLAPNDEKEIRQFIKRSGFCYTFHIAKDTIPSLIQTISGSADNNHVHYSQNDPFQEMLNQTFRTYNKQKLFVEVGVFGKHPVIVYRDVFMHLYRIIGSDIRGGYLSKRQRNTKFEQSILTYIEEKGSATRKELRLALQHTIKKNSLPLTKALESLARQLKLVRIREADDNGLQWTTPEYWNSRQCSEAVKLNRDEAIEFLLLRFIDTSIATSRKSLKRFFKYIIPSENLDLSLNSLIQRGLVLIDPELIIDGKRALKIR